MALEEYSTDTKISRLELFSAEGVDKPAWGAEKPTVK